MESSQGFTTPEKHLAEMLNDASIDRVMALDLNWNIISWNNASELASGLAKAAVIGKNFVELFPYLREDKELISALHAAFQGNKTFVASDKTKPHRSYYENHFIPLKENSSKIIGVMNIVHDVAHRVKAENQLRDLNVTLAEKFIQLSKLSEELTNFTTVTTDNIREPLQFIYTSLELLMKAEGRVLTDSSKANLRRMQSSLNRINRLIEDISALFRINSATQPRIPVNLNAVFEKTKQQMQRKIADRDVKISATQLPTIAGIPDMIALLIQNIVDNAIKFQPDGNSPVIKISSNEVSLNINTHQPDPNGASYFDIAFTDNGFGIPVTDIERVFGMFVQLHEKKKFPGSGLGLAFSQKIMETHNGFIKAENAEGSGTIIHCYFPVHTSAN